MIDYSDLLKTGTVTCDECGEDIDLSGDFLEVIAQAKEEDWLIINEKGEFKHYCPDCKDDI